MLEKIKQLGQASKEFLLWIVGPLAFIAGYIYYLVAKDRGLQEKLKEAKGDQERLKLKGETDAQDKEANDAVSDYERKRDWYLKGRDPK